MHQELVERRRWISEGRFLHALNYCMVLPGPEAQQLATYIGWLMHRTWGGLAAGGLFVLPSLAILIALAWIYMAYGDVPAVAALLYGVKPAVVAIVAFAAYRIGGRTLRNRWLWAIAIAAFVAMFAARLPFPLVIVAAGAIGVVGARLAPAAFAREQQDMPPTASTRGAGMARRRQPGAGPRTLLVASLPARRRGLPRALGRSARCAGEHLRLERGADADGGVLHAGRAADVRRCLCGPAVCLPGCRRKPSLADRDADDRRPRARRDHAGPVDHGRGVRRLRRGLECGGVRPRFRAGIGRRRCAWWSPSSRSCRRSSSSSSAHRSSSRPMATSASPRR